MEKRIDKWEVSKRLLAARLGLSVAVTRLFEDLPEGDGPLVREEDLQLLAQELFDDVLMPRIKELAEGLPEVTKDDIAPTTTPAPTTTAAPNNIVRINNTGAKMSWNSYMYDKFVFPKLGPEYTDQPFELVYSDGNRLYVPNPQHMVMTPDNMKYQPGGPYSGNNPDIPTMEVYARRDTHPEWVEARFRHPIEE